ncbi:MAG: RIP metalloprotease RseP, partial [Burkholderiaceae bacterium]|nr:RIP metalloprotease RseP [Burkholderiaceae bacterium]
MTLLHTLLAFIAALSVLILVHELGHYWVARLCNVKVLRFSLGMGKVLFSRKFGPDQTEWALSILPVGGYVKLLDARTDDLNTLTPEERKREFTGKNVWSRIAIVAAGPLSNFLLAIILLGGLYMYGVPEPLARLRAVPENTVAWEAGLRGGEKIIAMNEKPVASWQDVRWNIVRDIMENRPVILEVLQPADMPDGKPAAKTVVLSVEQDKVGELDAGFMGRFGLAVARPPAIIGAIEPGSPAEKSGLLKGDHVIQVNGEMLIDALDFVQRIRRSPDRPLHLLVVRGDQKVELTVVPEIYEEKDAVVGKIRAGLPLAPEMTIVRYGLFASIAKGVTTSWETTDLTLRMLGKMLIGKVSLRNITGPIAIADYAGQTARAGVIRYLHFIAFISISIGVMNLLPIP